VIGAIGVGLLVAAGAGVGAQRMLAKPAPAPAASAAPAPTVAAAPPPTASAALPTEVTIKLDVEPKEATVELDGAPVQARPLRLPRGEGTHTLTVRAPGYVVETREVSAREDGAVAIALKLAPPPAGAKPGPPSHAGPAAPPPAEPAPKHVKGPMETNL
jgi:hypothetical protein